MCPLVVYTDLDVSLCKVLGSGARRTVRLNVFGKRVAASPPSQAMGAVLLTFTPR